MPASVSLTTATNVSADLFLVSVRVPSSQTMPQLGFYFSLMEAQNYVNSLIAADPTIKTNIHLYKLVAVEITL